MEENWNPQTVISICEKSLRFQTEFHHLNIYFLSPLVALTNLKCSITPFDRPNKFSTSKFQIRTVLIEDLVMNVTS